MPSLDSLKTLKTLKVADHTYHYFSLAEAARQLGDLQRLPMSLKVLLENLLRWEDGKTVTGDDLRALAGWLGERHSDREIQYRPARVLMQDFTGVPAVVDLAAMRAAMAKAGGDPQRINPLSPVDLVIDHSVMVDRYASPAAFAQNVDIEMQRNGERYAFLRWGQSAFDNFRVVPPGTGICHQVNTEYLGRTVWTREADGRTYAFPTLWSAPTPHHHDQRPGRARLGCGRHRGRSGDAWPTGVDADSRGDRIQADRQAARGHHRHRPGADRHPDAAQEGVVGKFVEFYGDGLADLPLADRATIANMAPEYGATCGFFPVDQVTLDYLRLSGRPEEAVQLVEAYCKAQGLWRVPGHEPAFSDTLSLDMHDVEASLAGPKRPQDRVALSQVSQAFEGFIELQPKPLAKEVGRLESEGGGGVAVGNADQAGEIDYTHDGQTHTLRDGAVVIAAITSCTNTSNPSVMMAAGLVAKKAVEKGLTRKPWVKSSLAPGSKVVTDYFKAAGLTPYLDQLGFALVGYGCTTCIGNSGPLDDAIEQAIGSADLTVASVLSGNRNFEGRVHPLVKTNWLASPPLVVAYALAGSVRTDLTRDPLGIGKDGQPVFLRDIWPSQQEIAEAVAKVDTAMFHKEYAEVFAGDAQWQAIEVPQAATYVWQDNSTYIQHPPFFDTIGGPLPQVRDIQGARILALLGDSVTTDHISPAGNIKAESPAGRYLRSKGVEPRDFNSYGSRRGNHEVMMRGTFANIRIRNEMLAGEEGGNTLHVPSGEKLSIYDAAMRYGTKAPRWW